MSTMTIHIEVDPMLLEKRFQGFSNLVRRAVVAAVAETAYRTMGLAQAYMAYLPKTGRIYKLGGGRLHQASAPGEAPAVLTGALINSARVKELSGRTAGYPIKWSVSFNTPYAAVLEKYKQRPYLVTALGDIENFFYTTIERAIRIACGT